MIAGGAEDLGPRVERADELRDHILTAQGEDRAPPRAAILVVRHVAHHVLGADADGLGRLAQALDDRRREQEGVQMQLRKQGLTGQRVEPQEDRFSDAQRGYAGWQLAAQRQRQTAGVAAGYDEGAAQRGCGLGRQLCHLSEILAGRHDGAVAGEVHADALHVDPGEGVALLHEREQVGRQDALPQVADVDHAQHAVIGAGARCRGAERAHRADLGLKRDIRELHDFVGLLGRRRPQQPVARLYSVSAHTGDIHQAGVRQLGRTAGEQSPRHRRAPPRDLGDTHHVHARQQTGQGTTVLGDLGQVDVDGGAAGHSPSCILLMQERSPSTYPAQAPPRPAPGAPAQHHSPGAPGALARFRCSGSSTLPAAPP